MRRSLQNFKRALLILFVVLLFLFTVLAIIIKKTDPNDFKTTLAAHVKEATGADLNIAGDLSLAIFPFPHAKMEQVTLKLPLSDKVLAIQANQMNVDLSIISILKRDVRIRDVLLTHAKLQVLTGGKPDSALSLEEGSFKIITTCCGYNMPNFSFKSNGALFSGSLELITSNARPLLKGNIATTVLDVQSVQMLSDPKRLIPPMPLPIPFAMADKIDFEIDFKADQLKIGNHQISHFSFSLKSDSNKIEMSSVSGEMFNGTISGDLSLEPIKGNLIKGHWKGNQWSLKQLMGSEGSNIQGGAVDIDFSGEGHGTNLQEVLQSWNGGLYASMGQAQINSFQVKNPADQIMFGLLSFINPFQQKQSNTQVSCFAANFNIQNGVARAPKSLAIETNQFDVLGTGRVNLKNEAIQFQFSLREKPGLNLSLGSNSQSFELQGTLKNPKIVVSTAAVSAGILQDGASLFGAIATGGLSLVGEQVFSHMAPNESSCQFVRKGQSRKNY